MNRRDLIKSATALIVLPTTQVYAVAKTGPPIWTKEVYLIRGINISKGMGYAEVSYQFEEAYLTSMNYREVLAKHMANWHKYKKHFDDKQVPWGMVDGVLLYSEYTL